MYEISRLGPVFGAEVHGMDLGSELSGEQFAFVREALITHEVLKLKDQNITAEQQLAFGRRFGKLLVSPFSPNADEAPELIVLDTHRHGRKPLTDIWHSDETYRPEPPFVTILRACIVPELGGDTMFASMRAAYERLSDRMKTLISGLTAYHDFGRFDQLFSGDADRRKMLHEVELALPHPNHPVVRLHPETGRKVLFVNRHFTTRINELPDDEGRAILEFLLGRTGVAETQLRVSWEPNTVVLWDNRSVQHYAPYDYYPQRRRMERVTVAGAAPLADIESCSVAVPRMEVEGVPDQPPGLPEPASSPARPFERQGSGR